MVGIYAIKNKINNKIYIGRSTDIQRKTIERIFTNVYYKEEMEELKKLKPELFQS